MDFGAPMVFSTGSMLASLVDLTVILSYCCCFRDHRAHTATQAKIMFYHHQILITDIELE